MAAKYSRPCPEFRTEARLTEPAASFEDHLAREILASERLRIATLARVLAALIVFFGAMFALFHDSYLKHFATPAGVVYAGLILVLLLAYELAVLRAAGRWQEDGRRIPPTLGYVNALVETSVPSLLIVAIAREVNPVYVLQSAAVLLYGVFIVLSTLRLDARLSAFTGLVAAAEYLALCVAFLGRGGEATAGAPFESPPFYLSKAAILLLCGVAAGYVSHQLKRRVGNAWRAQQERQRLLDAFGQQVSPEIVDELLRQGGSIASRRATVCILFMDIRDFTPLVERMSPEEIVAIQNAVFGEAVTVVNRNRGIINQFLGDGFMATFGAPLATGRDSANALAAARELVAGVRALADAGRIPAISIGVGLHVGEAVSGNIGSAQRQQYSITGNVVILASRIEQLNKEFGSQILASREVLEAARGAGTGVEAEPLGPVHVKGRDQPIELFRVA
jgi:adenylate cyclase